MFSFCGKFALWFVSNSNGVSAIFFLMPILFYFIVDYQVCRGGGVLPYMGYIGMCGPKRYGF